LEEIAMIGENNIDIVKDLGWSTTRVIAYKFDKVLWWSLRIGEMDCDGTYDLVEVYLYL
jgi:hypothetical protein